MIHPFKTLAAFCLALAISGCTSTPAVTPPFDTATPVVSTPTFVSATPRPTVSPTPTMPVHSDNLARDCAMIISAPPIDAHLAGSVVIKPYQEKARSYLLNLSTGNKISLSRSFLETVSPDGKLLAYADLDTDLIVIADNSGKKIRTLPDPEDRLSPTYWLDNQRLMIEHRLGEPDAPFIVDSWIILDVLTGKMQEWPPDYPNLDTFYNLNGWGGTPRFLVNPQLSHVVYQAREGVKWQLIMWDIKAKKEISKLPGIYYGDIPWWSPDGTQILIGLNPQTAIKDGLPYIDGGELFTIDTDGKFKRLTYLTTTHFALERFFIWSPNGKAIAFMLQISPDNKNISDVMPELSVLNMRTEQVMDLCLPGGGISWSLDGKYILINSWNEQNRINEVFIVDLEKKLAWKIAENAEGRGWMIAQP